MTPGTRHRLIVAMVWTLRIVIGATFVMSGLAKAIDIWGFVYKIEEYVAVWGLPWWRSMSFLCALGVAGLEFVMGAMMMVGAFRRSVAWVGVLVMAFMLPLSLYIYLANPVSDCGCFGDFLVISNGATFAKNVLLTAGVIVLAIYNRRAGTLYNPYLQWVPMLACGVYVLIVALVGYNIQPLVDFRSFPIGSELLRSDADADSAPSRLVYERDGQRQEFTLDALPDSSWTFVEVVADQPAHALTDFAIIDDGLDIAPDIINTEGDQMLIVIPELARADISYTPMLNDLADRMEARGENVTALISGDEEGLNFWRDISLASYPVYVAEPTLLKELARGTMSLVKLHDGRVEWKRTVSSMSFDEYTDENGVPVLRRGPVLSAIVLHGPATLAVASALLVALLVVIGMPGWIASIVSLIRRKDGKKKAE